MFLVASLFLDAKWMQLVPYTCSSCVNDLNPAWSPQDSCWVPVQSGGCSATGAGNPEAVLVFPLGNSAQEQVGLWPPGSTEAAMNRLHVSTQMHFRTWVNLCLTELEAPGC